MQQATDLDLSRCAAARVGALWVVIERLLIPLAVAAASLAWSAHASDDRPVLQARSLYDLFALDLGQRTQEPPESPPSEALSAPAAPSTPVPQQASKTGREWYTVAYGLGFGPVTAEQAVLACRDLSVRYWRLGMADWTPCGTFPKTAPPPLSDQFATAFGPPAIPERPAGAIWYWRELGDSWMGPLAKNQIMEMVRSLVPTDNPQVWRAGLQGWAAANLRSADQSTATELFPNLLIADVDPPSTSAIQSDPGKATQLATRLAGRWSMIGPPQEVYPGDAMEVAISPNGLISVRGTVVDVNGRIVEGSDWIAGTFVLQPVGDDTALISATFDVYRFANAFLVFRLTLLDADTLQDDWSGLSLKRLEAFPSPP